MVGFVTSGTLSEQSDDPKGTAVNSGFFVSFDNWILDNVLPPNSRDCLDTDLFHVSARFQKVSSLARLTFLGSSGAPCYL